MPVFAAAAASGTCCRVIHGDRDGDEVRIVQDVRGVGGDIWDVARVCQVASLADVPVAGPRDAESLDVPESVDVIRCDTATPDHGMRKAAGEAQRHQSSVAPRAARARVDEGREGKVLPRGRSRPRLTGR